MRRLHWHLFRRGFAQGALQKGADVGTVQEMLRKVALKGAREGQNVGRDVVVVDLTEIGHDDGMVDQLAVLDTIRIRAEVDGSG